MLINILYSILLVEFFFVKSNFRLSLHNYSKNLLLIINIKKKTYSKRSYRKILILIKVKNTKCS